MIRTLKNAISPEEYLARKAQAEYRSEYRDGESLALAGGSLNHNQIIVNLTLPSLQFEIPLPIVYDKVDWAARQDE